MTAALWKWRWVQVGAGCLILWVLFAFYRAGAPNRARSTDSDEASDTGAHEFGKPADLPLPSQGSVPQFEQSLFEFLNARQYVQLGWVRDKGVRDTGPYIGRKYYGTHPAVRVYYSPGILRWLTTGKPGKIPDGEMIIKEQYPAPAIRHDGKTEELLWDSLESWTVMVKDSAGSHDGWFWSNPVKGQCVVDHHRYPFPHPVSGFGIYCVRCHAATHSAGAEPGNDANEFTFASLRNIAGYPGTPLQFRVDDSWRPGAQKEKGDKSPPGDFHHDSHPRCARSTTAERSARKANAPFQDFFASIKPSWLSEVSHLPPATHDWVVNSRDRTQEFVTSNQCMSCHAGLVAPFGPSMYVPVKGDAEYGAAGWDVSPYGEWRWTPMALSGRDPIFYAQVESEMQTLRKEFASNPALASELGATLAETCLRCHGAMGAKQFGADHDRTATKLSLMHMQEVASPGMPVGHGLAKYGALLRDGVSCTVCHRMQPRPQPSNDKRPYLQYFLETSTTGNFHLGKKGEIYGPFKDDEIAPYTMEHATGLMPKKSEFLQSSQLCGTCHTVVLPAVDKQAYPAHPDSPADDLCKTEVIEKFQKYHHHVEQATYLEWLNSQYENEIHKQNPLAKSCQDCHMSPGLKDERHGIDIPQIQTRIAAIQDSTYPDAENLAAPERLHVRFREKGYKRHNFAGLNVFLLELFNQFDDVLGVPKTDFMTGSKEGIAHAVDNFVRTARNDVASLQAMATWEDPRHLTAHVTVTNKVGHRFPSGVGFRRAFLELAVVETTGDPATPERIIWASGRTNELGVLLGANGQPLPSEFFTRDPKTALQQYQKHHEVITSRDQVQVYEMLRRNEKGEFTTSFVCGCDTVKDNRLLPRGWKREGPGNGLTGRFLEATYPDAATAKDPRYTDGSGSDELSYRVALPGGVDATRLKVRASLYYQAIPPYFLRNLFETAPDAPATRRLHYLCSHADLKATAIENWKLLITTATCEVTPKQ